MKISANEIKIGNILELENKLWKVLKLERTKPGKGGAYIQVELKDIKDGTTDVANKDKEISKSIKKQNDLLKEQKGLKKAIASESEKEVKLQDILESYEKRINLLVKTSTKDEKEQLRAKDGIVDRSKIILEVAETAKKTEGEKGDILAEIAVLMHDIDDTSIQNLQSERDIGKEGFRQLSLKDKEKRFAEIKRRIGKDGLRDFEEELHYLIHCVSRFSSSLNTTPTVLSIPTPFSLHEVMSCLT